MWSEGRYDYERLPRERLPPRSHPSDGVHRVVNIVPKKPPLLDRPGEGSYNRYNSHVDYRDYDEGRSFSHDRRSGPPHRGDESSYRWPRDDHSASRQPEYRDVRDGFRRKSFYSSHYARDRSPHKRDNSYLRESPVGRKDSPHSRSGSSVSSRSYSPERSKTYSFHQSQHRKSVRAGASYKRQNEGKPERGKERPLQAMKTSGDTSPSSSSAVTSSKVLDKPSRLTEKELAEAASKWAAEKVEKGDESNLPEISEYEPVSVARVLQLSSVVLASCDPTKPPEASTGAQRGARAPLAREQKMPHNQSGSPAGTSDQPLPQHRLTRKERRHLRATLHKMRKASLTERDDKDNILRLYYQAKTIQHRNPSKPPGIVPLLVIMLSLAASGQASMRHLPPTYLQKREAITAITIASLLGLVGAGTGIAAHVNQQASFSSIRRAVDQDISRLESSIAHLEKSLNSLSEVVLQNRRALDLLFLKEGGLCAALGEECCFYVNHSSLIRDNLEQVRLGLEKRKREREGDTSKALSWGFNGILSYLLPLLGPFITFLLILSFGPWAIKKIIQLIKDQINCS
ncbi:periphilin-1 isoform X3 [Dasypus novemcinctus]